MSTSSRFRPAAGDVLACQITVPLSSYEKPEDFVVSYTGSIHRDRRGSPGAPIGQFLLYKVLGSLAISSGKNAATLCAAHSPALRAYGAATLDSKTGSFLTAIQHEFECVQSNLLVLHSLVLRRPSRDSQVGLLAARKLIDLFGGDCGLVVCGPCPGEGARAAPRVVEEECLWRCCQSLGVRRIGGTSYYGLSITQPLPSVGDLLRTEG